MDTEKCKVLLRAVDTGSFTAAAEELGYTPSGITHMMNALEEELGVVLLRRSRTGVTLTEAGKSLIGTIRRVVVEADRLEEEIGELQGLERGHVAIATGASFGRFVLPQVIARFHERYPNITLELHEDYSTLRNDLAQRRFGLAFLTRMEYDTNFISLCSDELLAVVPEDHPLAEKDSISLEDLSHYPYIGMPGDFERNIEQLVKSSNGLLKPILTSQDEQAILAMVRAGLGVSIVAGMHVYYASEGILGIPLDPPVYRDVGVALPANDIMSPAEKRFVEVAQEVVAELIEDGVVDPPPA
jgi:DNA-binding transcriptional LysR family regulator